MDEVNEGSYAEYSVGMLGLDDAPVVPVSVAYRIDDSSGAEVRDWTTVAPGSSVVVPVLPEDAAILAPGNQLETRTITVRFNEGTPTQFRFDFRFLVRNLRFAP